MHRATRLSLAILSVVLLATSSAAGAAAAPRPPLAPVAAVTAADGDSTSTPMGNHQMVDRRRQAWASTASRRAAQQVRILWATCRAPWAAPRVDSGRRARPSHQMHSGYASSNVPSAPAGAPRPPKPPGVTPAAGSTLAPTAPPAGQPLRRQPLRLKPTPASTDTYTIMGRTTDYSSSQPPRYRRDRLSVGKLELRASASRLEWPLLSRCSSSSTYSLRFSDPSGKYATGGRRPAVLSNHPSYPIHATQRSSWSCGQFVHFSGRSPELVQVGRQELRFRLVVPDGIIRRSCVRPDDDGAGGSYSLALLPGDYSLCLL